MRKPLEAAIIVLFVLAAGAGAQGTGTVSGTVYDQGGASLPGVQVELDGESGTQNTVTDRNGRYSFADVAPGSYTITANLDGFGIEAKTVEVAAGASTSTQFALRIVSEETITITGSFIPSQVLEEGAAPLDVIARDEFESLGSPDYEELIRNIPQMYGHTNQTNQFSQQGLNGGTKAISLRGFGAHRNLVLINSERALNHPLGGPQGPLVDVGAFPKIALKRIDILKEASPIYGSDAITGVFNYITDNSFVGFKVDGWHSEAQGQASRGDNYLGVLRGFHVGALHLVTSLDYTERGELRQPDSPWFRERTLGLKDGLWPQGNSTLGNPGGFIPVNPATGGADFANARLDPDCGITDPLTGGDSWPISGFQCGYYYVQFDNFIDPQKRINFFNELTLDLDGGSELYGHLLFTSMDYDFRTSPSYPPTAVPGLVMYVPPHNPGLANFVDGLPAADQANWVAGGLFFGRPRAIAGFAREGGYAGTGIRKQEMWQLKGGNRGSWGLSNPVSYDFTVTYGSGRGIAQGNDVVIDRWAAALGGMGGPECNPATGTPGVAPCYYWNPFYAGYRTDDPALVNRDDVWNWMEEDSSGTTELNQLRISANFSGGTGVELGGGAMNWAAGLGYDGVSIASAVTGIQRQSTVFDDTPLIFLPLTQPFGDFDPVDVYNQAAYAELRLPFAGNFELSLAARYTDVPWLDDNFTKGRAAFRWLPAEQLILRGSFGQGVLVPGAAEVGRTTFRLQFIDFFNEFIIIETPAGNLTGGLGPEEADTWNLGFVWHPARNWTFAVDRWDIAFSGPILQEGVDFVINNRPEQIIYGPLGNVPGALPLRLVTRRYNGPDLDTSGWDFNFGADFFTGNGTFSFRIDGSLLDEFFFQPSDATVPYDALGRANTRDPGSPFQLYAIPELKYNARVEWQTGPFALSLIHHFTDGYDTHYIPFDTSGCTSVTGECANFDWSKVDSFETQDLFFSYRLPGDHIVLRGTVVNITDEAPPVFRHEHAYDASAHSPLGRVVKLGLSYSM